MQESLSILSESVRRDLMVDQLNMIARQEKHIPNSVEYDMRRFVKQPGWQVDDIGMLEYKYVAKKSGENALVLKFCLSGQAYCDEDECQEGVACKKTGLPDCSEVIETVDVYSFRFTFSYLKQFLTNKATVSEAEKYLSFQYTQSVSHIIPLAKKAIHAIHQ